MIIPYLQYYVFSKKIILTSNNINFFSKDIKIWNKFKQLLTLERLLMTRVLRLIE